jgi:hypothetical protein
LGKRPEAALFEGDASHVTQARPLDSHTEANSETPFPTKPLRRASKRKTKNRRAVLDFNQAVLLPYYLK